MGFSAGNNILAVSATIVSSHNCRFNTNSSSLVFGTLDPASPVDRTANTSVTFRCTGGGPPAPATFFIKHDSGLHSEAPGSPRMRHATVTTEYLPYSLTLNPTTGTVPRNTNQTLTISGTVAGSDFQGAYAGSYTDTVVLSITP